MKIAYSAYCAKGNDGKTCPFSQYLIDNVETIDKSNSTDLDTVGKKALANDCRETKCHQRLISIKEISDVLDTINNEGEENSTSGSINTPFNSTDIIGKYYESYSKNQCGVIDGSSSDAFSVVRYTMSGIAMVIISILMLI
ncbi:hypothetical protein PIROE2DRAFT_67013 [Piromyces sp. E2]|nr:hypothetical protein PIROE2DRAFT_67013 [Piromyces sp. E2]|eukprot:OUM67486.1 hypothetical protein PIROE2DRAFT_67013 [Piromyces sp. E2]